MPRAARSPLRRRQAGYALLVILLLFSLLALAIAAAVPAWTTAIKREREQASIDYAREYVMGIRRYYHKFGAYPPDLDRLEETDNIHYLRHAWRDPLAKDGKWRFVHPGDVEIPRPPGSPQGTGLEDLMQPATPAPASPAGQGSSSPVPGMTSSVTSYLSGMPEIGGPLRGGLGGASGGSTLPGASPISVANSRGMLPSVNLGPMPPADGDVVGYFVLTPAAAQRTGDTFGAPIIGIVSRDTKLAVHEFNGKDKPSDWLFVYDPAADRRALGGAAALPAPPQNPLGGLPPTAPTTPPAGGPGPGSGSGLGPGR